MRLLSVCWPCKVSLARGISLLRPLMLLVDVEYSFVSEALQ